MSDNQNATVSGTQPSSCSSDPTAQKIGKTVAYCLIFVVSLAGNTVIGIIVYKTKTMRKPINFLIVNMAMSDLLLPTIFFPSEIQTLYTDSWLIDGPLGQALCKLTYFFTIVSTAVSIQSLVLIAVGRFGAVLYPLRSPLISSKLCPFFILVTCIVAMACLCPYLFFYKLVEYHERLVCHWHWEEAFGESSAENYFVSLFVVLFFVPFVVIAILYIIIFLKLKSQRKPGEQSANAGQQRQQRERNVLKMAIAIVLGFAVCWLPNAIGGLLLFFASDILFHYYLFYGSRKLCLVLFIFASDIRSCGFHYFSIVASFMAQANCAINPCICFIFSRNYRDGLKTLLS